MSTETVDGVQCTGALIQACRDAVDNGCVSLEDASRFLQEIEGSAITAADRWALRLCMTTFKWSDAAYDWMQTKLRGVAHESLEEPCAKRLKTKQASCATVDGVACDRSIIDACRQAVESGVVSAAGAAAVWTQAAAGGVDMRQQWTLRYCLTAWRWTGEARDFLIGKFGKVAHDGHKEESECEKEEAKDEGAEEEIDWPASEELKDLRALVLNLDRRPDRWTRIETMLQEETPWLKFQRFSASDGSKMKIPESEIVVVWNTGHNAVYGDYDEWVFDAPGTELDGTHWKFPGDVREDDTEWTFVEHEEEASDGVARATIEKVSTKESWTVKCAFAERYRNPGMQQRMSGGERGCAHSHRRVWEEVADSPSPILVLEDDAQFVFKRTDEEYGMFGGALFTERLGLALREAPDDFDVVYLGWSGYRGGNFKLSQEEDEGEAIKRAEYVWTTVAYVVSPAGARKLLAAASPMDQPVDNFMAWEASQRRLKSYVAVDECDADDLWAGGIVDQFDFQGDSDIKKSDGGIQHDGGFDSVTAPHAGA
mmetsp:Transcript_27207/g.71624  ORF Transcript_27207/g.71624 Transcript_27207/m.71624 type:complete len:540 (-) Transcript_27207:184-1803(-)